MAPFSSFFFAHHSHFLIHILRSYMYTCHTTDSRTCTRKQTSTNKHAHIHHMCWPVTEVLILFCRQARYHWTHGISPNMADRWRGSDYIRKNRISITWRKVILENSKFASSTTPPSLSATVEKEHDGDEEY